MRQRTCSEDRPLATFIVRSDGQHVTVSATEVGVAIAAVSAFASAASAYQSARSVALSHRPFVVGTITEIHLLRIWICQTSLCSRRVSEMTDLELP